MIKKIKLISVLALTLLVSQAFAGFEILNPPDADGYGQHPQPSQARIPDPSPRSYALPRPVKHQGLVYRAKILGGQGKTEFKNLSAKENLIQGIFGLGIQWQRYILDLELMGSQKLDIPTQGPIPTTTIPLNLKGDVKPFGVFATASYWFPTYFNIFPKTMHPYINMGLGVAINTSDVQSMTTAGAGRQVEANRQAKLGWNLGVGLNYKLYRNVAFDMSYRYTRFGDVEFGPVESLRFTGSSLQSKTIFLGLVYSGNMPA